MRNHLFKHKKSRSMKMFLFTLCILFVATNIQNIRYGVSKPPNDLAGVKVAVYNGSGALESSYDALVAMFEWMNATVNSIDSHAILNGNLSGYDILAFPGGNTLLYQVLLGDEGIGIVRHFLRNGGSYFGICGGALFGTDGLNLIQGEFLPTNPAMLDGSYILEMNVNRKSIGPDLSDEPATYHLLYWSSQYYHSAGMSNINPIMTYQYNNQPGMITFRYGTGTVFLSFPHPEYEENSDRDGTSAFNYLYDPDSEWNLLLKISLWLYLASGANLMDPGTSIIIVATTAIAMTVFIIYQRRKR
jgi:glutamine amidotransferase-like uncharacterized protein